LKLLRKQREERRRQVRRFPLKAMVMVIAIMTCFILLLMSITVVEVLLLGMQTW
jgi:hypothetical protein